MAFQDPVAHPSGLSNEEIAHLRKAASKVAANAYAPYSHFQVGAAILLDDGEIMFGCNVENASYRLTCCAEQSAIASAVTAFGPAIRIVAVAIANLSPGTACPPCGACRQTILEFATENCWIFYAGQNGAPQDLPLRELLPASFHLAH